MPEKSMSILPPGLSRDDLKSTGIIKTENVQAIVNKLLKNNPNTVVIPDGPYVVGIAKQ